MAQHASLTWLNVRVLFGSVARSDTRLGGAGAAFGLICLLAALFGLARVMWTWRRASRAEQLLVAAIVFNVGTYLVTVMPSPSHYREVAAVLPCGAVLAARALVPARIIGRSRAFAAVAATGLIALLPLAAAATRPPISPATAPLAAWLEAHGLTYGIAGYWDASIVTLQSGNRVQIRAVDLYPARTSTRPTGRRTRSGTTPPGTTQRSRSPTPTAVTRRPTSSTSSASQRRPTGSQAGSSWSTGQTCSGVSCRGRVLTEQTVLGS